MAKKAKAEGEELAIMIPPSGTRKKTDRWKSGFYYIARGAEIPVIPAYLDSKTKTYGYGDPIYMDSGSIKRDMDKFREFYDGKVGLVPGNESTIVLKEELKK